MILKNFQNELNKIRNETDSKKRLSQICRFTFDSMIKIKFLIFYSIFPLYCLIVGLKNREHCVIQPMIPIWLIIFGAFLLFMCVNKIVNITLRLYCFQDAKENAFFDFSFLVTSLFLIIWFICGNYWIYSNWYNVRYDQINVSIYTYRDQN
jgi:hypothetical protein